MLYAVSVYDLPTWNLDINLKYFYELKYIFVNQKLAFESLEIDLKYLAEFEYIFVIY